MREQTQWVRIPREELARKQIFHGDLGGRFETTEEVTL